MRKPYSIFNGLCYSPLIYVFILLFISCKQKEDEKENTQINLTTKKDSLLSISVKLNSKKSTGFNLEDKYHSLYFLDFKSRSSNDTIIVKQIPKTHNNQVISYYGGILKNGKIVKYNHHYLVTKNTTELSFIHKNGDVILENSKNNILDNLYNDYKKIKIAVFKAKGKHNKALKRRLDSINMLYIKKYENNKVLTQLNKYHYIDNLQNINPLSEVVNTFLSEIKKPIVSSTPLRKIFYHYVKNNIYSLHFRNLNTKNYSKEYIELVSIGVFNFLRNEDNKGDKKNQLAIDWLKTTNLYKRNSVHIDKEVTPLNNITFKKKLKNINLLNTSFEKNSLLKIIKNNPSEYYLIDFWATWCAPCIKGVHIMKKMKIPKEVVIISLSTDKASVKEKWKTMTQKLGQKVSYLIKEEDLKNKEFFEFIKLQSVPRYILIDKNMNLIDQAFLHPQEPLFLPKLKDIKNHKHW